MIGLISNYDISKQGNEIYYVYKNFFKLGFNILVIPLTDFETIKENINMCNGIIMQGGDDYLPIHLDIIKYIYDNNIPLLAICMSMQAMGVLFNGSLKKVKGHKNTKHEITINPNTLLYKIFGVAKIKVNSYHKWCVKDTLLTVSAYSNVIEAIEDTNKKFFLGIQWHPEKDFEYDKLERKIFDYFKEVCDGVKRIN